MIAHRDAGPDDRRPHTVYADKPAHLPVLYGTPKTDNERVCGTM